LTSPALLTGFPSGSVPFGTFVARLLDNGTQADLIVEALEKRGLARRLAEPNLVVLSGDTANFLAGGEFPFPVQGDEGRITVEFKKFGVGLAFTPTVLSDGQINLKIEPEVSDIDFNNAFTLVDRIAVPALVVRRANTTVELRDGQSFAIAGLLQTKHSKDLKQIPWIGNVPVLGALFRSSSYEKEESDLVIIVTPRLVQPAVPGQKLLTPLDQKLASNDRDYFKRGVMEVPKHFPAPYGHVLDVYGEWAPTTLREVDHAPYK
jgi:pilus assembly protein CpaC